MNTWRWPSRTSTQSAVLTTSFGATAARFALRRAAVAAPAPRRRQLAARRERVDRRLGVRVLRQHLGQRRERQPQPERRIAGDRVEALAPQRPRARLASRRRPALASRRRAAAARSRPGVSSPCCSSRARRARSVGCERSACSGSAFAGSAASPTRSCGTSSYAVITIGGIESQPFGERGGEPLRGADVGAARRARVGEQRRIAPQRLAVGAPVDAERPARQRLAGIPLALPDVQEAAGREALREPAQQRFGQLALLRRQRRVVPLGAVHVVDRHERRLAALREPHVVRREVGVDAAGRARRSPPTARRCTASSRAGPRGRG